MGRPKMDPMNRKTEQVNVAMTPAEYARLRDHADRAGENLSAFMRAAALGKSIPTSAPSAQPIPDFETRQELRRIGNNLNQIAKAMNAGRDGLPASLIDCTRKLDDLFERWLSDDYSHSPRPQL